MYTILQTESFAKWLAGMRDVRAKVRIVARLRQAEFGNLGDVKSLGSGISELRVDTGPGYRLYFTRRREVLIILLAGGDKSTQKTDIKRARKLAEELEV
jgi:putative addiction module killer protein